jgi:probable HAF family extracellular repeat protein
MIKIGAGACAALCLAGRVLAQTYTVVDLGPGVANALNNLGQVVGDYPSPASPLMPPQGSWLYDGTNTAQFLVKHGTVYPILPGGPPVGGWTVLVSSLTGINDLGSVVGKAYRSGVFFVSGPTGIEAVPSYTGFDTPILSPADAWIFGHNLYQGITVKVDGTTTSLVATPEPVPNPTAINAQGAIVGNNNGGSGVQPWDGLLYASGQTTTLDLSPVTGGGPAGVSPADINAQNKIVGSVTFPIGPNVLPGTQTTAAFVYNGTAVNIGSLGVGKPTAAAKINDNGVIVGYSGSSAFIYKNGVMSDLNALIADGGAGWQLAVAVAINNSGQIAGNGTLNGVAHAFLLKPTSAAVGPSITQNPVGVGVYAGQSVTLTAAAQGTPPLSFQWQFDGTNIAGATGTSYSITNITEAATGQYQIVVSNTAGSATSLPAHVQVSPFPKIAIAEYAGVTLTGAAGGAFYVQAVENASDVNWTTLATVTLTNSPQLWLDFDSPLHPDRLYRIVLAP